MSEEITKRKVESEEAKLLVLETANKIDMVLREAFGPINEQQAWLLCGRVINLMFSRFYLPAIVQTEKRLTTSTAKTEENSGI
ncbi:MAG TPA: hypothetical protein VIG33_14650 [Pseudobdellovibrionaceae bacterium]